MKGFKLFPVIAMGLGIMLVATSAQSDVRRAVIVGNSQYPGVPLANPRNDANLLAETLHELGFNVVLYHDVVTRQVPDLLERIDEHLSGADISLFYYAGHGLQYQGENLLLPVDADLTSEEGIALAGTPLTKLLQTVTSDPNGIKIVVLDACRNEILAGENNDLKPGFSFVEAPSGEVVIAFSTSAGETAFDSAGGDNSPYTVALANAFQQFGADIYDVFRRVRGSVRSSTGGQQIPWITGSIETEYIFRANALKLDSPATPGGGLLSVQTESGEIVSVDRVLWEYLRSSANPFDFVQFAEVFPDSTFAKEATELSVALAAEAGNEIQVRGSDLSASSIVQSLDAELSDKPAKKPRTSQLLDQSGSYVMRDSFRTWPLELPATQAGLRTMATQCDEESSDPVDPDKLSPGISSGAVNIRRALRACAFDLAEDPNNPRLLFQFARILDIARKHEWANAYYDQAIALQYGAAMVARGFNARRGRGQKRDEALAFQLYKRAAEKGNLRARTNLGNAYLRGGGVEKNLDEGVLWLRLAASMGWPHAVNALGDVYRMGQGVEKNDLEAAALYRSAAEQGQTTAMANLGRAYLTGQGVDKDVNRGLNWLERSMSLGNGYAPVFAGWFYMSGSADIPADPEKARVLFEAATRRGNARGYLELASRYADGKFAGGVDMERAFENALFAKAGRVRKADELIERISGEISDERRGEIQAKVKLFIRQNGL